MRETKVVILGSGGVGKSCLTIQLVHQVFVDRYDPTIEDSYRKIMSVDGETFAGSGNQQFYSLHSLYIRGGDGFILVYSLTSIDSVNELTSVRAQILRIKEADGVSEKQVPLVLVGNKCDLVEQRAVPREVGIALSGLWNGCPYYESSARNSVNITEVFEDILRQIIRRSNPTGSGIKDRRDRSTTSGRKTRRCTIL